MEKADKCYTAPQLHSLAQREIQCQKDRVDLNICQNGYDQCVQKSRPPESLGEKLKGEFLGYTISFSLGVLVAATHCLGLCK